MRPLSTLPIPPSVQGALSRAGFHTTDDVGGVGAVALSEAAGITRRQALDVLRAVRGKGEGAGSGRSAAVSLAALVGGGTAQESGAEEVGRSAYALLLEERQQVPIITFCAEVDEMLGGGVPLGKVTEFTGAPGIGKTQLGMQLAVDVQIPEAFGGAGGSAIYIDTEGSFVVERAVEIASAVVSHLDAQAAADGVAHGLSLESVLSSIAYYRVHSYVEQIALINLLPGIVEELGNVRLVVIDSVAFHFRHDFANMGVRTRVLNGMAQSLTLLAEKAGLAVVLMNQVTTRGISQGHAYLAPALGESWGHAATVRVNLFWDNGARLALLFKSPSHSQGSARFAVTVQGIRSEPPDEPPPGTSPKRGNKRLRASASTGGEEAGASESVAREEEAMKVGAGATKRHHPLK
ncbi:Rad51 DNA recombinase 3 [Thecamonas trahens ATCC 50062]|uniref:DNA repair protein RAD51 homolog 3 n=1 Tax=Thecamonas trahens ATCC 50062 TaxID=461836 RepID=A0A0L0DVQ9_THETB|nr:Rad51 DNA recombinase 3 [Thecamonas trahens ATCC 50062]KNC56404.1 Rad51 DNA recombinase 3 [Thecamonas trahens ATCC 50062]|eukprot:XP_013760917.1 Rad51 DNA recombinase 3 [Thecamonas trahens ATCC 50062]